MKVRKIPIETEAWSWPDGPEEGDSNESTTISFHNPETNEMRWQEIHTVEGIIRRAKDDWLIKDINGELYPCKPDIFSKTYEVLK